MSNTAHVEVEVPDPPATMKAVVREEDSVPVTDDSQGGEKPPQPA